MDIDLHIPDRWSDMLYGAASPLEHAIVDAEMRDIAGLPSHLITGNLDPEKVQSGTNLTALAYGIGVTLWEDRWSEGIKREWLKTQWQWKSIVGTLPAYDMALAASGYRITDEVLPPAGFYASPPQTDEERASWIRQMPQIRIKYAERSRIADYGIWFADDGAVDVDFAQEDFGREITGRIAVLRYPDGHEVDLQLIDRTEDRHIEAFVVAEELSVPFETMGMCADIDFADDGLCLPDEAAMHVLSIKRDETFERVSTTSRLSTIDVGLQPLVPYYEQDSDIAYDDVVPYKIFADDGAADIDFCLPDDAAYLLADRVYLNDPAVAGPMTVGLSFADADRVGMPEEYLELIIDTGSKLSVDAISTEDNFADLSFAMPTDTSDTEQAIRAVVAAKALRDTVLVSFEPRRLVTFGDPLTPQSTAVDWIDNHL